MPEIKTYTWKVAGMPSARLRVRVNDKGQALSSEMYTKRRFRFSRVGESFTTGNLGDLSGVPKVGDTVKISSTNKSQLQTLVSKIVDFKSKNSNQLGFSSVVSLCQEKEGSDVLPRWQLSVILLDMSRDEFYREFESYIKVLDGFRIDEEVITPSDDKYKSIAESLVSKFIDSNSSDKVVDMIQKYVSEIGDHKISITHKSNDTTDGWKLSFSPILNLNDKEISTDLRKFLMRNNYKGVRVVVGEYGYRQVHYKEYQINIAPAYFYVFKKLTVSESSIDFKPPQNVIDAYKDGLKRHENGETGDGLEPITVKMAKRFASGEPTTPEWARKGNRWWGRNDRFKSEPKGSAAYAAAQLWGGKNWFATIVKQLDKE